MPLTVPSCFSSPACQPPLSNMATPQQPWPFRLKGLNCWWETGKGGGACMQEGHCLLMDPFGLGQDVHSGLGSGHCALQLTPLNGQGERPSHRAAGGERPTL